VEHAHGPLGGACAADASTGLAGARPATASPAAPTILPPTLRLSDRGIEAAVVTVGRHIRLRAGRRDPLIPDSARTTDLTAEEAESLAFVLRKHAQDLRAALARAV
jgi:hypothetical protein